MQDLRTPGDPTGLDGTLIRIDPRTGAGVSGNPLFGSADANERRILAYGLRDSVRLAIRPGTNDVWVGDRGGGYWEEFNRVPDAGSVRNFGWPCYEGGIDAQGDPYTRIRPRSDEENMNICNNLYAAGDQTAGSVLGLRPRAAGRARRDLLGGRARRAGGQPAVRHVVLPGRGRKLPGSLPQGAVLRRSPAELHLRAAARLGRAAGARQRDAVRVRRHAAMDLEVLANGDLLYVDQENDAVHRISYVGNPANQAPTAVAAADKVSGAAPLTVGFDATGLDRPGHARRVHLRVGPRRRRRVRRLHLGPADSPPSGARHLTVSLRVTDTGGLSDTDSLSIEITEPITTLTFSPDRGRARGEGPPDRQLRHLGQAAGRARPRRSRATCASSCRASTALSAARS